MVGVGKRFIQTCNRNLGDSGMKSRPNTDRMMGRVHTSRNTLQLVNTYSSLSANWMSATVSHIICLLRFLKTCTICDLSGIF